MNMINLKNSTFYFKNLYQKYRSYSTIFFSVVLILVFVSSSLLWLSLSPTSFEDEKIISIKEGLSVKEIGRFLKDEGVVRSPLVFQVFISMIGAERGVIAGDYYFEDPVSVVEVSNRLATGDFRLDPWNITIPEGSSILLMANKFGEVIPKFDKEIFLDLASEHRGYLFPETYSVTPVTTEEEIVDRMISTFERRVGTLGDVIEDFGKPLEEVVIMASILEAEASIMEDRRKIAGVLWNRLEIGMPLQVDAAFVRVNGKNTYELTLEDLAEDNPFNTYTNTGLPPEPITNPGLESIESAVTPIESNYLYYLADREGNTYYSETHDQHVQKKNIYVN